VIVAHLRDKTDLAPQTVRRDGLVGPFSTESDDGILSRMVSPVMEPGDPENIIDIGASRTSIFPFMTSLLIRFKMEELEAAGHPQKNR